MVSHSITQTKETAKKIASKLKSGAVLGLVGNLGTGKTHFVKGIAEYFEIKNNITSPTFVLLKLYPIYPERSSVATEQAEGSHGKSKITHNLNKQIKFLIHIDCYRLNNPEELIAIGLNEYLENPDYLVVIEWAEKIKSILPKNTIWIKFSLGKKENERKIEIKNNC
jgi:tRNA threonylcarbamoyladenosine biosynthesis protein TsaE